MPIVASAELRDRKANLVTDIWHEEQLQEKEKLGMFRHAHSSLYLLCSQKRKEKNSFLLFPFHCNTAFPAQVPNSKYTVLISLQLVENNQQLMNIGRMAE